MTNENTAKEIIKEISKLSSCVKTSEYSSLINNIFDAIENDKLDDKLMSQLIKILDKKGELYATNFLKAIISAYTVEHRTLHSFALKNEANEFVANNPNCGKIWDDLDIENKKPYHCYSY